MIRHILIISTLVPAHMYGMMTDKKDKVPPLITLCTRKIIKKPDEYRCLDFPGQISPPITAIIEELKKGHRTLIKNQYKRAIQEYLKRLGTCIYIKNNSRSTWNNGKCVKTTPKIIRDPKTKLYIDTFNETELTEQQKLAILLHSWYQQKLTEEQIEIIKTISHKPLRAYMTAAVRA